MYSLLGSERRDSWEVREDPAPAPPPAMRRRDSVEESRECSADPRLSCTGYTTIKIQPQQAQASGFLIHRRQEKQDLAFDHGYLFRLQRLTHGGCLNHISQIFGIKLSLQAAVGVGVDLAH